MCMIDSNDCITIAVVNTVAGYMHLGKCTFLLLNTFLKYRVAPCLEMSKSCRRCLFPAL
jgi:hypothetical protein